MGANQNKPNVKVMPIAAEQISVGTQQTSRGKVTVRVTPRTHQEHVSLPVREDHIEVRRVAVERIVDAPPPTRQEGDTLIVPVLEEVLVVEKRLMLREEIHVVRRVESRTIESDVALRTEEVHVDRQPARGAER